MAYQIKRRGVYTSDLELTEADGTAVHTLHVEIDPDSMARKLSEKQVALVRAMQDISAIGDGTPGDEAMKAVERAVTDMLEAVFGADGAATIARFYQGRYIEMSQEVIPYITMEVIPKVREMAQESRKQAMQSYNRKQRRLLGRM